MALSWFENQVLPGLLQTEEYAQAVLANDVPVLAAEEVARRARTRVERQEVLRRGNPMNASFVVSEAVLMDRLGGEAVRGAAIRYLRECGDLPGVDLQVLPLGRETHPALDGPFVLLETPEHQHLAYTETQRGSQLISDANEVSILARKYAMLRTQALNPEETRSLLDRLLGEK